jgi:hypothetical protein
MRVLLDNVLVIFALVAVAVDRAPAGEVAVVALLILILARLINIDDALRLKPSKPKEEKHDDRTR